MTESILRSRHTVRVFKDEQIDQKLIEEIIAEAQFAPSWCNSQPWKAYVATGDLAKKICDTHYDNNLNGKSWAEVMPPQDDNWNKASAANRDLYLSQIPNYLGEEKAEEFLELNRRNFNSSAIVYITVPKNSAAYEYYDAGAFGYGIALSAYEHGIGSIPAYEFVRYPQEIRAAFDIPEDEEILIGIGLGYAKEDAINMFHEGTGRVPLKDILLIKDK
jgi:nitroreductase